MIVSLVPVQLLVIVVKMCSDAATGAEIKRTVFDILCLSGRINCEVVSNIRAAGIMSSCSVIFRLSPDRLK